LVQCPSCGTPTEADFGMISCSKCSAVFMVEMDGTVRQPQELSSEEFSTEPESEPQYNSPEMDAEVSGEINEVSGIFPEPEVSALSELPEGLEPEDPPPEISEEAPSETEYSENFMDAMNDPQTEVEGAPADEAGLDVSGFAASPASQIPDGLYYYDVKISSLDSGSIRQSVIEALSDSRFDWLPEELKKSITGGELILKNLNPVKAVLAVIKLQSLDVEVEWSQKLYTDPSVQENEESP
jgi:hypothetical protein